MPTDRGVLGIIPARYASSRFPAKPLVEVLGIPMVIRVAKIAADALGHQNVIVATDDRRIADVVERHGFRAEMTSSACLTGTDRLAEVASRLEATSYVNIQGDEPMLDPEVIVAVAEAHRRNPAIVVNAMAPVGETEDVQSVNLPKVITTETHRLVYMSRRALPGFKSPEQAPKTYWKQVCVYGFSRWHLAAFSAFGRKSTLEASEDIEILRFLDLGVPVDMVAVSGGSLAIDVPEDVEKVESALRERGDS